MSKVERGEVWEERMNKLSWEEYLEEVLYKLSEYKRQGGGGDIEDKIAEVELQLRKEKERKRYSKWLEN